MRIGLWISLVLLAIAPVGVWAANPAVWSTGTLETTGGDVFWMSPTTVTTGLADYDWTYEIIKVEARATIVFPTWLDVTDQLPANGVPLTGGGSEPGVPFVLVDESLNYSGNAATFLIEVDSTGRGKASITDVAFGSILGLNITGIRASLNFSVTGYPYGDYNHDLAVDSADYALWMSTFGSTTDLAADGNRNGLVDASDYVVWRDHFGQPPGAGSTTAIPEPSSFALLAILGGVFLSLCLRRSRT